MTHISIGIPTYNSSEFIATTLNSVLAQKFDDFDVVIIDDCSTDSTREIIAGFCKRDSRIRYEVNKTNLRLTNWNRCLEEAQGPLVHFLAHDDVIDPDFLSTANDVFSSYPEVGFIGGTPRTIDKEGNILTLGPVCDLPKILAAGDEAIYDVIACGIHVSSFVMRRKCYEKLGLFNTYIWHGPDVELPARFATRYDFYRLGRPYTSFRRHDKNTGVMNFFDKRWLSTDMMTVFILWSYLSSEMLLELGIRDLERHVSQIVCSRALSAAASTLAYGRSDLSRFYIQKAIRLDPLIWRKAQFWRILSGVLFPRIGQSLMRRRMRLA